MRIDVITIFPDVCDAYFSESIIKRARDRELIEIQLTNLRDFTHDKHRSVDDRPYGGGAGMVMKPEPLFEAVEALRTEQSHVIMMSPQGNRFTQQKAQQLRNSQHLILICGHYEGFDERIRERLVDEEISIGDYVLTSGMLPAMVITDAVVRLLPGVLGCADSAIEESFSEGLLEYPHYTRPEVYRGMEVPPVLLSGNHGQITKWRQNQSELRTRERRPDLWQQINDTNDEDKV
ncbi:MAG TPA: tRNA (guanosine(37)-N1)-methyltransferase TrmD [Lentisphaeria bacterium]|nr:tRNA (guanosine(37)-N1)-methyltransferase TrmD [Lentisphaeria bacterium]